MRSSRLSSVVALATLVALAACEIEKSAIPPTVAQLAVHGVLSPSAGSQVVILERTRNGTVSMFAPSFELYPQVSDEGIAERGATMLLEGPDGERFFAIEDRFTRGDGRGEGIYRFALPGAQLARGRTYALTVTSSRGEVLHSEASVPGGEPAMAAEARDFDRDHDTLTVEWPRSPGARSYWVRVETPYGPRMFFTDSNHVRLTGELRNVDAKLLKRVFIPGFQQAVTVSAVDSNFYDWYRTSNDVFTGTGVVNRVSGGFGVFGSLVRLRFANLHVVAPQTEPVEGRWEFTGTAEERAGTPNLAFELYVESHASRSGQPDAVSGRVIVRPRFGYTGCLTCGVLGTVHGSRVTLAMLGGWFASDTVDRFTGDLRGDTLVGAYQLGGSARFVRVR